MKLCKFVARGLIGGLFIFGGYGAATKPGGRAKAIEAAGLAEGDKAEAMVRLNGVAQVVGGVSLTAGFLPRTSAAGLIASMVPTTVVGHPFWKDTDPAARQQNLIQFLKNASIVGGLMMVVGDSKRKCRGHKGRTCCKKKAKLPLS